MSHKGTAEDRQSLTLSLLDDLLTCFSQQSLNGFRLVSIRKRKPGNHHQRFCKAVASRFTFRQNCVGFCVSRNCQLT
ncbi:MAG: hypothetical protein DWH81_12455 [Planctomycetota bacterium]|nr:MAG: hypothetical protein DWH81_12455 [Planctomycetota bacterium]